MSSNLLPQPDRTIISHQNVIHRDLSRLVGADRVISDDSGRRVFDTDATSHHQQVPLAVVFPASHKDVSLVLSYASENRIRIIPRGAGTSQVGAAVPTGDAVVVCLSQMDKIIEIDYVNRFVTVEAGVTTAALNQAIFERGFFYPPDPTSAIACTLGGNVATNAGGAHGLKYGSTSNYVLALTVVLMSGEIIEIGGAHLDAPGYNLAALLTGAEGQLGIVTQLSLRILGRPEASRPVLFGFASIQGAGQCVAAILKAGILPSAIEFMDKTAIEACEDYSKAGYPTDVEALLIVDIDGSQGEISSLQSRIVEAAKVYAPNIVRVSQNAEQSAAIWKGRKFVFRAIARSNTSQVLDASIPLGRLAEVLEEITGICARAGVKVANVFHAGEGNLHPILIYNDSKAGHAKAFEAREAIMKLCIDVGGSLSGEYGVGLTKRDLMATQFTDVDLAIQMRVKTAFDPDWLLNDAKVFPFNNRPAMAGSSAG